MLADKTFKWCKGDVVKLSDVPCEVAHLFDAPQQYHWNYPNNTNNPFVYASEFMIIKSVVLELFGNMVIISFPQGTK